MFPKDLLTIAALGTENNGMIAPHTPSSMSGFIAQCGDESLERHILRLAGGLTLQRRAGWIPPTNCQPIPTPCEIDDRPVASPLMMMHLRMMQLGPFKGALPEWLREMGATGKRIPVDAVITLLEIGRKNKQLRELIMPVLGKRGMWVAEHAHSRNWCWFNTDNIDELWLIATEAMRVEIIQALRKTDPAMARRLVESVWDSETVVMRQNYLQAFHEGLSVDDEALLNKALHSYDSVSRKATVLLSKIPESAYIRGIADYATQFLYLNVCDGDYVVEVDERRKIDTDAPLGMLHISYMSDPVSVGLMLSYVPPHFWLERFKLSAEAFLKAVNRNSRYAKFLLEALVMATYRFRDQAFADVLLDHTNGLTEQLRNPLYVALSRERFEQLTIDRLNQRTNRFSSSHPAVAFLYLLDAPWSHQLSKALIYCLERGIEVRDRVDGLFMRYAIQIPIGLRDVFMRAISSHLHYRNSWDAIEQILDFRTEMLEAIHRG